MSEPTDLPTAEVLDQGTRLAGASAPHRRWPWVAAGAAAVVVSGAGVALGLALSGGGTQPEELVPAGALVYADVDFDPEAGQKVNLVRLLSKFPEIGEQLGGRTDVKEFLIEQVLRDGELSAGEVTPWLGDRAGVAALWDDGSHSPVAVVALEVTDQGAAEQTLSDNLESSEYAFRSGYVVIVPQLGLPSGAEVTANDVLAQSQESPLADDPAFVDTMKPLGPGLASVYLDGDGATKALESAMAMEGIEGGPEMFGLGASELSGHAGVVVRAEPSAIEVVGRTDEVRSGIFDEPTQLMSTLPDTTAVAVAAGGGGDAVAAQWQNLVSQLEGLPGTFVDPQSQVERKLAKLEARYGVRLPDDLITLLGDDLVVAVDGEEMFGSVPKVGLRSVTDPDAARDLARRLQPVVDDVTAGFGVTMQPVDDGLVVASTPEYADVLVNGSGGLLADPAFANAVPDAEDASFVVWVDIETLGSTAALFDARVGDVVEPLEAFGASAGVNDDGEYFTARLTFKD